MEHRKEDLRDKFAMAAFAYLGGRYVNRAYPSHKELAEQAYSIADKMMAARNIQKQ